MPPGKVPQRPCQNLGVPGTLSRVRSALRRGQARPVQRRRREGRRERGGDRRRPGVRRALRQLQVRAHDRRPRRGQNGGDGRARTVPRGGQEDGRRLAEKARANARRDPHQALRAVCQRRRRGLRKTRPHRKVSPRPRNLRPGPHQSHRIRLQIQSAAAHRQLLHRSRHQRLLQNHPRERPHDAPQNPGQPGDLQGRHAQRDRAGAGDARVRGGQGGRRRGGEGEAGDRRG
mmetsp:Transcript_24051/g.63600  ORF Transcript_24051/g.63600 Transcript_24051/m.63600 type:complete len:231 (-) Transcript_24051:444-1136(-)